MKGACDAPAKVKQSLWIYQWDSCRMFLGAKDVLLEDSGRGD